MKTFTKETYAKFIEERKFIELSATMKKDVREITLYKDIEDYVFSAVLLCKENTETRDRRKLYYTVLNSILSKIKIITNK